MNNELQVAIAFLVAAIRFGGKEQGGDTIASALVDYLVEVEGCSMQEASALAKFAGTIVFKSCGMA